MNGDDFSNYGNVGIFQSDDFDCGSLQLFPDHGFHSSSGEAPLALDHQSFSFEHGRLSQERQEPPDDHDFPFSGKPFSSCSSSITHDTFFGSCEDSNTADVNETPIAYPNSSTVESVNSSGIILSQSGLDSFCSDGSTDDCFAALESSCEDSMYSGSLPGFPQSKDQQKPQAPSADSPVSSATSPCTSSPAEVESQPATPCNVSTTTVSTASAAATTVAAPAAASVVGDVFLIGGQPKTVPSTLIVDTIKNLRAALRLNSGHGASAGNARRGSSSSSLSSGREKQVDQLVKSYASMLTMLSVHVQICLAYHLIKDENMEMKYAGVLILRRNVNWMGIEYIQELATIIDECIDSVFICDRLVSLIIKPLVLRSQEILSAVLSWQSSRNPYRVRCCVMALRGVLEQTGLIDVDSILSACEVFLAWLNPIVQQPACILIRSLCSVAPIKVSEFVQQHPALFQKDGSHPVVDQSFVSVEPVLSPSIEESSSPSLSNSSSSPSMAAEPGMTGKKTKPLSRGKKSVAKGKKRALAPDAPPVVSLDPENPVICPEPVIAYQLSSDQLPAEISPSSSPVPVAGQKRSSSMQLPTSLTPSLAEMSLSSTTFPYVDRETSPSPCKRSRTPNLKSTNSVSFSRPATSQFLSPILYSSTSSIKPATAATVTAASGPQYKNLGMSFDFPANTPNAGMNLPGFIDFAALSSSTNGGSMSFAHPRVPNRLKPHSSGPDFVLHNSRLNHANSAFPPLSFSRSRRGAKNYSSAESSPYMQQLFRELAIQQEISAQLQRQHQLRRMASPSPSSRTTVAGVSGKPSVPSTIPPSGPVMRSLSTPPSQPPSVFAVPTPVFSSSSRFTSTSVQPPISASAMSCLMSSGQIQTNQLSVPATTTRVQQIQQKL